MRIMLCDDEKRELEHLEGILENYADAHPELDLEISSYSDSFALLTDTERLGAPDIALLDICMPGILGTEVARELQDKTEGATDIIFLTTSAEFAVEAFALRAEDYLKKPYTEERLTETLDRVISKRQKRSYALIQSGKDTLRVDLYTVVYAEVRGSNVEVHLRTGTLLQTRTTLARFAELFREMGGFVTVGASYLVNLRCVRNLRQTTLELSTGETIPVPRRLRPELKKEYFDFYKQEALGL